MTLEEGLELAEMSLRSQRSGDESPLLEWIALLRGMLVCRVSDLTPSSGPIPRKHFKRIANAMFKSTIFAEYGEASPDLDRITAGIFDLVMVAQCLSGDGAAFAQLRTRYGRAVAGRIRSYLGGQEQTAEIEEEAWKLARRELPNFAPAFGDFKGFLDRCVDAICRNEELFINLYTELAEQVQRYIRSNHRFRFDEAQAKDVEQTVWKMVWEQLPRYDPARGSRVQFVVNLATLAVLRAIPAHPGSHSAETSRAELPATDSPDAPLPNKTSYGADLRDFPDSGFPPDIQVWMTECEQRCRDEATEVLSDAFIHCPQPHMNLAFGFNVPLFMFPLEMVRHFWPVPLPSLAIRLRNGLVEMYSIGEGEIDLAMAPLRRAIREMHQDEAAWLHFAPDEELQKKAEERATTLEFQRTDAIRKWVCTVLKRIHRA
jgi:hypothetical protein